MFIKVFKSIWLQDKFMQIDNLLVQWQTISLKEGNVMNECVDLGMTKK